MIKTPYQNVVEAEQETMEYTEENFPKEIELFKVSYNEIVSTMHYLCKEMKVDYIDPSSMIPSKEFAIILILSKFISSSIVAFNLIMKGYYEKSRIFLRSMLEDWELIQFFYLCSEKTYSETFIDLRDGRIKIGEIASRLQLRAYGHIIGSLSSELGPVYGYWSNFVHPTMEVLISYLKIDKEEEKIKFKVQIAPVFKEEEFYKCTHLLISFNGVILFSLKQIFEKQIREAQIEDSINQVLKSIGDYIGEYLRDLGRLK